LNGDKVFAVVLDVFCRDLTSLGARAGSSGRRRCSRRSRSRWGSSGGSSSRWVGAATTTTTVLVLVLDGMLHENILMDVSPSSDGTSEFALVLELVCTEEWAFLSGGNAVCGSEVSWEEHSRLNGETHT